MMTENQKMRLGILGISAGNVEKAKEAYSFVMGENEQLKAEMPDGIYLRLSDGRDVLFTGTASQEEKTICVGIGVKQGSRSLTVALADAYDGDIELTNKKDTTDAKKFYKDNTLDAVADWDGAGNTEHIKKIGTNIELPDNEYIPSFGQLYFIYTNLKAINEALKSVGSQEIEQCWYWSSTEFSSTRAWFLYLDGGGANYGAKASYRFRVRAVSAFLN